MVYDGINDYKEKYLDKIRGCMIGGAVGDALGYPIEFMKEDAIWNKYGPKGITTYDKDKRSGKALISDDTQMSLFTATGLLSGETKRYLEGAQEPTIAYVFEAYKDWLATQEVPYGTIKAADENHISWLMDVPELYAQRVPGNTCITAMKELKYQSQRGYPDIFIKRNDSKGAGGIMRVAPYALYYGNQENLEMVDKVGGETAMITHCHSLGYIPAAFLTHVISRIIYPQKEMTLEEITIEARDTITKIYADDDYLHTVLKSVNQVLHLAENGNDDLTNIHQIGEGWVAEETLAIALYCTLRHRNDFSEGIITSVNHKGDSDTTGAVTGNILGAINGYKAIDSKWKENLEIPDVILEVADDLCVGNCKEKEDILRNSLWKTKYIDGKRIITEGMSN